MEIFQTNAFFSCPVIIPHLFYIFLNTHTCWHFAVTRKALREENPLNLSVLLVISERKVVLQQSIEAAYYSKAKSLSHKSTTCNHSFERQVLGKQWPEWTSLIRQESRSLRHKLSIHPWVAAKAPIIPMNPILCGCPWAKGRGEENLHMLVPHQLFTCTGVGL